MTKQEILEDRGMRVAFIQQSRLPITVNDKYTFQMRLIELNKQFGAKQLFADFCEMNCPYKSILDYIRIRDYYDNKVREKIREYVSQMRDMNFEDCLISPIPYYEEGDIHNKYLTEDGDVFLRVRLKDHYISPLKFIFPEFCAADTCEEFLSGVVPKFLCKSPAFQEGLFFSIRYRLVQLKSIILLNVLATVGDDSPFEQFGFEEDSVIFKSKTGVFHVEDILKLLESTERPDLLTAELVELESLNGFGLDGGTGWRERVLYATDHEVEKGESHYVDIDPNLYHLLMIYASRSHVFENDLIINVNGRRASLIDVPANPFT